MLGETHKGIENVCGKYLKLSDIIDKGRVDISFEIIIQIDYLLPFSGMTLLLSWVICDLELEIRNRINCNLCIL